MVRSGELAWVGAHRKIAKYRDHKAWDKVYTRNKVGEVFNAGMQLVRGLRR